MAEGLDVTFNLQKGVVKIEKKNSYLKRYRKETLIVEYMDRFGINIETTHNLGNWILNVSIQLIYPWTTHWI